MPAIPILQPRRKALLIGIQYSKTSQRIPDQVSELPSTHGDTKDFRKLLKEQFGYVDRDIVMMLDEEGYPPKLYPTHKNIRREMQSLVKDAREGDSFVLYYAGHTEQVDNNGGTEDDDKDEGILAVDFQGPRYFSDGSKDSRSMSRLHDAGYDSGMIIDDKLRIYLVNPLPKGSRLTAIFDSCHSATLLDLDHYKCNNFKWSSEVHQTTQLNKDHIACETYAEEQMLFNAMEKHGPTTSSKSIRLKSLSSTTRSQRRTSDKLRPFAKMSNRAGSGGGHHFGVGGIEHIDIPLCISPIDYRRLCDGLCPYEFSDDAVVVSVSACTDGQLAWDGPDGTSMTKILIKMLRENPQISLKETMNNLGHYLSEHVAKMNQYNAKRRKRLHRGGHSFSSQCAVCGTSTNECASFLQDKVFQEPKLGGSVRLDLNKPFLE